MGNCPLIMYQNLRRTIATVSQGEARILQAPDSDVSLQIPEGSKGLFTMRVHTDHIKFRHLIPPGECIIAPPVEVEHTKLSKEVCDIQPSLYVIKIPHSLRNTTQYQTIKVRRGEGFHELPVRSEAGENNTYEINQQFITIYTTKFSPFICTSCQNTCQATVMLFLLGYLEPRQEADDTLTQIKSFICSDLYRVKDFREVSLHSLSILKFMFLTK